MNKHLPFDWFFDIRSFKGFGTLDTRHTFVTNGERDAELCSLSDNDLGRIMSFNLGYDILIRGSDEYFGEELSKILGKELPF